MCIGVWTLQHPGYSLILCANRDEYLDRPTLDAHFHSFQTDQYSSVDGNILSGRDVVAGGSWFGLNRAGRVALLTNITEPPNSFTSSSRGHLISSFLSSDSSSPLEDEVGKVVSSDAKFAGFNLLLLAPAPPSVSTIPKETLEAHERELELTAEETRVHSRDQKLSYDATLVTNHGGGGPLQARRLVPAERACGCISNGIDGKGGNEWPKVRRAVSSFDDVLKNCSPNSDLVPENLLVEKLFDILTWQPPESIKERAQLRDTIQVAPISLTSQSNDAKQIRTPHDPPIATVATISVSTPKTSDTLPPAQIVTHVSASSQHLYGTRLSTVLLVRSDGSVLFIERDIWRLGQDGNPERVEHNTKQRVFEFELDCRIKSM